LGSVAQHHDALVRRVNETTLHAETLIVEVLSEVQLPDDVVQELVDTADALGEIRDLLRSASTSVTPSPPLAGTARALRQA